MKVCVPGSSSLQQKVSQPCTPACSLPTSPSYMNMAAKTVANIKKLQESFSGSQVGFYLLNTAPLSLNVHLGEGGCRPFTFQFSFEIIRKEFFFAPGFFFNRSQFSFYAGDTSPLPPQKKMVVNFTYSSFTVRRTMSVQGLAKL